MGLIKRGQLDAAVRDAVRLNLTDIQRQAQQILAQARQQADAVRLGAERERKLILSGAAEQGRNDGYAQGLQKGMEEGRAQAREESLAKHGAELAALLEGWQRSLHAFESRREEMLQGARQDVVRLAIAIAERVVAGVVGHDERVVVSQVEEVLALLSGQTRLTLTIHPDDEAVLAQALPDLQRSLGDSRHVELVKDASIQRGSCVAHTPIGGSVDASIGTRLDRVVAELLVRDPAKAPGVGTPPQAPSGAPPGASPAAPPEAPPEAAA